MKRLNRYIFIFIIFMSVFLAGSNAIFYLEYNSVYNVWNLDYFVKTLFLFNDKNSVDFLHVNITIKLAYYSMFLISILFLSLGAHIAAKKYRSMVIHRYIKKDKYLLFNQKEGLKNTVILGSAILFSIVTVYIIFGGNKASLIELAELILNVLNIVVFLNICVILNIYFTISYNSIISITVIVFLTMLFYQIDYMLNSMSFITYGSLTDAAVGFIIQLIIYLVGMHMLKYKIKNVDVI